MSPTQPPRYEVVRRPRAHRRLTRPAAVVVLAAGLLAPAALVAPAVASTEESVAASDVIDVPVAPIDGPDVRFAAVGDIHDQWGELTEASDFWAEQDVQAALLVGDLTDSATAGEYDGLKQTLGSVAERGIRTITSMGNHDVSGLGSYDRFTEATGGQRPNSHYTVSGYHVITVSPGAGTLDPVTGRPSAANSGAYAYAQSWLRDQLTAATADDPTKPVMVMVHHPLRCTHYVSDEWHGSGLSDGCGDEFSSVFDDFPQAVVWGGHIHTPQNIPTSIWQGQEGRSDESADKGFTSVNAPPLVYYEFESGVIGTSPTSRSSDTTPDDAGDNRQTAIIEITGSKVTIKNYDLLADEWIDQTWTWDVADSVDTSKTYDERFPFNSTLRSSKTSAPIWPAGSALAVDEVTGTRAMVSFPQAVPAPNTVGDIVHKYRYAAVEVATGVEVNTFVQWSGFYNLPMPESRAHEVWNLLPEREYEVRVTPINAWGAEGEALSTRFTTGEPVEGETPFDPTTLTFDDLRAPVPTADLLDVDFVDGSAADVSPSSRALTTGSAASIVEDADFGGEVVIGGEGEESAIRTNLWSDDEYAELQDGFTLDTTFRLDSIGSGFVDVFGGMQSGGIGLEAVGVSPTSYELQFWYASPRPTVELEYGRWYHVTAWYDGRDARLFVDGAEKAATEVVSFNVKPSSAPSRYMAIGGDANPSADLDVATMDGRIGGVEMYSEALSDAEVYRVAMRELTALDTVAPLLNVDPEPAATAVVGEPFDVPGSEAVDNSGRVTSSVAVTGPDGEVVELETASAEIASRAALVRDARVFTPVAAGAYTVTYAATDAAGAGTEQVFTVMAAEPGDTDGETGDGDGGSDGGGAAGEVPDDGGAASTGGAASSDDANAAAGDLATTGGAVSAAVLALAMALVAAGVVLGLRRRRDAVN